MMLRKNWVCNNKSFPIILPAINIPNTDEWYIVYHRRPIPNLDRDHRVTCIDKLYFTEDGTIKNVKMTFDGVRRKQKGK